MLMRAISRTIATIGALLGWAALVLQLCILIGNIQAQGGTGSLAVWRFFGYFTILTNILVAIVFTDIALLPERRSGLANLRVRLSTATAIAMVGIVYSLALRHIWTPQGWQKVADVVLHDVTPALFLVFCVLLPGSSSLRLRDAVYALLLPCAYVVYAFIRGAADGWYPYYFLDPTKVGAVQLTLNAAGLLLAFWVVAVVIVGIARLVGGAINGRAPIEAIHRKSRL